MKFSSINPLVNKTHGRVKTGDFVGINVNNGTNNS